MPDPTLTPEQLAATAQVDSAFLRELVELGILRPSGAGFVSGDVWRVRILRAVTASGVPVTAVAGAFASQDFDLSFLDTLLPKPSEPSGRTFDELAASLGERGDLVEPVASMLGLGAIEGDRPTLVADDRMLTDFIAQWGADPDIALRAARLVGQTTQRFAEGWAGLHYEHYRQVLGPDRAAWTAEQHAREAAAARSAVRLALAILPWMTLHHVERLLADDVVENLLTAVGPFAERVQDPASGARLPAVAFIDMSGYTALTEAGGNAAAARVTSRFETIVATATAAHGGRVIKLLGDGALLLFPGADACHDAAAAVREMRDALMNDGLQPHAGIHQGPVVERDGDIFGRTVNLASRLASAAGAGQIVVSDAIAAALHRPDPGRWDLEPLGGLVLKGIDQPIAAWRIV